MFTLPLWDDNPTNRTPWVTWLLMATAIAVFLWQQTLPDTGERAFVYAFGVIPAVLLGGAALPPELAVVPPWASVFTSMFVHGGWMHMIGNMLFLWIFGNNVEDSMGHARYLVFYLLCGVAAVLAQALPAPGSEIPMIGASGAIAGVLGAYLLLHPKANVVVLLVIVIFVRLINVPAVVVLGLWFVAQLWGGLGATGGEGGVAFLAHVGGFVAGVALIGLFKERQVPLFGAARSTAFRTAPGWSALRPDAPPQVGGVPVKPPFGHPGRHRGSVPPSGRDDTRRRPKGPWS